jgi:hypothetical protein
MASGLPYACTFRHVFEELAAWIMNEKEVCDIFLCFLSMGCGGPGDAFLSRVVRRASGPRCALARAALYEHRGAPRITGVEIRFWLGSIGSFVSWLGGGI